MIIQRTGSWFEVFGVFLKLGLTSFGGPIAHLGYFRHEIVERRRWLDENAYADLVALCQFLPGPASSQVGIGIGLYRAGLSGALAAWTGFTLPSALALVLFALGLDALGGAEGAGWLHGLKVAAVAVVAQAVWGMARTLAPDRVRASFAVAAAAMVLLVPTAFGQVGAIVLGGLGGLVLLKDGTTPVASVLPVTVGRRLALACLLLFFALLVGLPLAHAMLPGQAVALADGFYRAGSLVFGGGHVVLPLLQAEVVPPGWLSNDAFLAGYGAAQAVPGPLFTFAAYLGAVMGPEPNGWTGAALCLLAIFLPSFLLVIGALPFWDSFRRRTNVQAALKGVNAVVVGLLLAALYDPVWKAGITSASDFALAITAFLLLTLWKTPPWAVVALSALGGAAIAALQ
ncbi:MAG: chromate efflux transporter [Magnetospirillum gryphiswaldense]|nr:chromate efflux transporter [Magnetospirillum gryphiswaldense]